MFQAIRLVASVARIATGRIAKQWPRPRLAFLDQEEWMKCQGGAIYPEEQAEPSAVKSRHAGRLIRIPILWSCPWRVGVFICLATLFRPLPCPALGPDWVVPSARILLPYATAIYSVRIPPSSTVACRLAQAQWIVSLPRSLAKYTISLLLSVFHPEIPPRNSSRAASRGRWLGARTRSPQSAACTTAYICAL